jgi:hypothetical protein
MFHIAVTTFDAVLEVNACGVCDFMDRWPVVRQSDEVLARVRASIESSAF